MAKKPKESKYAARLRELGFVPYSEETEAYMNRRIERRLGQRFGNTITRNERRIIAKEARRPRFLIFGGDNPSTHATDELGKSWIIRGKSIDLEPYGFQNDASFASVVASMPPLPPDRTN